MPESPAHEPRLNLAREFIYLLLRHVFAHIVNDGQFARLLNTVDLVKYFDRLAPMMESSKGPQFYG